jgi:hypothetical protein
MRVFLSWSGSQSRFVALALREWLPLVLHYTQPWMSERDIAAGEKWSLRLGEALQGTEFGIIIVTAENASSAWMLFEAGAIANRFAETAVAPLLVGLDLHEITGPLAQFQAKRFDADSIFQLVQAINAKAAQPVDISRLQQLFRALWPELETKLAALPQANRSGGARSVTDVLEDLVVSIRRLDANFGMNGNAVQKPGFVVVNIRGDFAKLRDAQAFNFPATRDIIREVAEIAGVDVSSYGAEWFLTDPARGDRRLEADEGALYLARSQSRTEQLILHRL